jgi:hypothetical protein
MILACLVACTLFASVPQETTTLVGTWSWHKEDMTVVVSYSKDGTYRGRKEKVGYITWEYEGRWTLKGRRLHYVYTASTMATVPPGTEDDDELLKITPDFYETKNVLGWICHYSREK